MSSAARSKMTLSGALVVCLSSMLAGCSTTTVQPTYTAILDAGSSGTRINLYRVVPGRYPAVQEIFQQASRQGEYGINAFLNGQGGVAGNLGPADVGPYVIGPLLESIRPKLVEWGLKSDHVLVELLATAGMRGEEKRNGGKHADVAIANFYKLISRYILDQGFPIGEVRTTDGNSEEGKWTWIQLNDIERQAFTTESHPVGVVEVGGASMQVSYPTHLPADADKNIYAVAIGGKAYSVFSKSYQGLGQNDARKSMRITGYPESYTGGADCYPTGMTTAEDPGDVNIRASHQATLPLVKIRSPEGQDTVATFDFQKCSNAFNKLIDSTMRLLGEPETKSNSGTFLWHRRCIFCSRYIHCTRQCQIGIASFSPHQKHL